LVSVAESDSALPKGAEVFDFDVIDIHNIAPV